MTCGPFTHLLNLKLIHVLQKKTLNETLTVTHTTLLLLPRSQLRWRFFFSLINGCSNNFHQLSYELRITNLSEVIFLWYATEKSCITFESLSVYMLYQCWKMSQVHLSTGKNSIWWFTYLPEVTAHACLSDGRISMEYIFVSTQRTWTHYVEFFL